MSKSISNSLPWQAEISDLIGRPASRMEAIAPGLGHRLFFRVYFDDDQLPQSLIARVDPTGIRSDLAGQEPALEPIRAFLEQAGLPVPRSYAHQENIQLLEDLGDASLETVAHQQGAAQCADLYSRACALVPRLQELQAPARDHLKAFHRKWGPDLVASKAEKWLEWSFPLLHGRPASAAEKKALFGAFDYVALVALDAPLRLAHRDFKAANIHLRPGTQEPECVMIDLQGAFLAPPEYDLVCLLRDAHVGLPEEQVQSHLRKIRLQLPDQPTEEVFMSRFDLITLTRVSKDLSHYLHAATHRDDRRYLAHVPQALRNLKEAARRLTPAEPALAPWLETIEDLPPDLEIPDSKGGL